MFLVDDHVELLATQYSTRRMAGIVEDVFDDWARNYPELFPVQRQIQSRAALLDQAFQSYILRNFLIREQLIAPSFVVSGPATQAQIIGEMISSEVSKAMPRLYIAAIEDQLTLMSGATQKGKRLSDEIVRVKEEITKTTGMGELADRLFDQDAYAYIVRNSGANSYVSFYKRYYSHWLC
jgi:hypothetical protein